MKKVFKLSITLALLLVFSFASYELVSAYGVSPAGPPVCGNTVPGTPQIKTLTYVSSGTVEVTWDDVDLASSWTVAYGVKSGTYIYGVHNFGDDQSRAIRISQLPGGTYYFALRANNGCMPGQFSAEKTISLGGGTTTTTSTTPVTYDTTPATPTPTTSTKVPTPKTTTTATKVSPTPVSQVTTVPHTGADQAAPQVPETPQKLTFWQKVVNFFKGLFGGN